MISDVIGVGACLAGYYILGNFTYGFYKAAILNKRYFAAYINLMGDIQP